MENLQSKSVSRLVRYVMEILKNKEFKIEMSLSEFNILILLFDKENKELLSRQISEPFKLDPEFLKSKIDEICSELERYR